MLKNKKPGAEEATGQEQKTNLSLYTKKSLKSQPKITHYQSDDNPIFNNSFCHYLRIKNFDTTILFNEKITRKQKRAMESIIANCMKMPGEQIPIAFHRKFFNTGTPAAMSGYGFKPFDKMRYSLEKAGYIETHAPRSYNTDDHPISWLKGTQKLYDTVCKKTVIEYKPDFVYLMKGKINESDNNRQYIPLPKSPRLRQIRAIMEPYHKLIEQHKITCNVPSHKIQRHPLPDVRFKYPIVIFSDNLESNGRLYNSFWTGCKREYRKYLRIDGSQCVELDFKSMHPNILYQMEGYPPQRHIYLYSKADARRNVVKLLLLALINIKFKRTLKETRSHTIQAAIQEFKSKHGIFLEYQDVSRLLSEIETRHTPILKHFYNSAWRYCTAFESNLIKNIIKTATKKNILVLSVHDSVICKAKDIDVISAIITSKTNLPFTAKMFR